MKITAYIYKKDFQGFGIYFCNDWYGTELRLPLWTLPVMIAHKVADGCLKLTAEILAHSAEVQALKEPYREPRQ